MDAEHLIGTLIRGALGSRRKRSRGALQFLTGSGHSLLNAGTLLTAAGVAWGLYETLSQQGSTSPTGGGRQSGPGPGVATTPSGPGSHAGGSRPPPVPASVFARGAEESGPRDRAEDAGSQSTAVSGVPAAAVPLQADGEARSRSGGSASTETEAGTHVSVESVSPDVLRVIRLTIAAARADGALTPREEETILAHARAVGAEKLVRAELQRPTPLAALVAGARPEQRRDLYTLAFAVSRADETVSGGERIFLAQLAHQLGLDAATVAELEASAAARISEGA
jgi:tellurite resistance protein